MLRFLGPFRRRRIVFGILATWLLYLFFKHMPTDLVPVNQRFDSRYGRLGGRPGQGPVSGSSHTSHHDIEDEYDGPVRFFGLAPSLRPFFNEPPAHKASVLFAFASLRSASPIVAAACSMAVQNRSTVHVAAMGKEEVTKEQVLKINRIVPGDCPVYWHPAQVDFATQSSPSRLSRGVEGALSHIHRALAPRAVLFDDSQREDDYLRQGLSKAAESYGVTSIQIPHHESWLLDLDANALSWWDKIQVDIVIRVQPESAGSLLRLLRSLRSADYGGLPLPRIVIDLPARTDMHVLEHLRRFVWPPRSPTAESKLTLRHRVDDKSLSPAAAALQAIESFYPVDPTSSHVLVLSPEVELSKNYYQLLLYLLLEYKYGEPAAIMGDGLMGISLLGFADSMTEHRPFVLSQSLQTNAALFFGDQWAEMHQYLSMRLTVDPQLSKEAETETEAAGSASLPTWAKLASEMMRAQGYTMLYPHLRSVDSPLAALHTELPSTSEEENDEVPAVMTTLELGAEKDFLTAQSSKTDRAAEARTLSRASLLSFLGRGNGQDDSLAPAREQLPLYSHQGKLIDMKTLAEQASLFAKQLSTTVGQCPNDQAGQSGNLESLFC
ncbi:uncharacterized protein HMPREF1541_09706 [Cyphellophora europaea CBS 101466]|uniref:Uncharacterized protein n=1 Tax=Cyphellophora europaea (strain CBS 101466) TaxID=1220924 RepID=W2S802_CYPE1|nr:uncharacterized protein HMPREF1541_09706 [Cyphellophora europaea CBS 101466]ETN44831.1 hypothetical protein HMPREF1541_09706 [Cyphellophora europaea CBS 101466]